MRSIPTSPTSSRRHQQEPLPRWPVSSWNHACDAFCEDGVGRSPYAPPLRERRRPWLPHPHAADQFNSLGMTRLAVEMGALERGPSRGPDADRPATPARSETIGVLLLRPGSTSTISATRLARPRRRRWRLSPRRRTGTGSAPIAGDTVHDRPRGARASPVARRGDHRRDVERRMRARPARRDRVDRTGEARDLQPRHPRRARLLAFEIAGQVRSSC